MRSVLADILQRAVPDGKFVSRRGADKSEPGFVPTQKAASGLSLRRPGKKKAAAFWGRRQFQLRMLLST
jgi:hypothetical protein